MNAPALRSALMTVAVLCLALTACNAAFLSRPHVAAAVQRPALEYYHWLRGASAQALEREQHRLEEPHPAMDPLVRDVCLAMLLSSSRNPSRNEALALQLLQPLAETGEYAPDSQAYDYLRLGLLLRDMLAERRQLQAGAEDARQESASSRQQARELQRELGELRHQIEALKSIEQQINQRQSSVPSP